MDEYYQFFVALFTLIVLLYLYFTLFSARNGNKNLPPSPPKLPILGHLHLIGRLPHRSLHSLSKKHGPLMLLQLGSKPVLVVSSAEIAKEILKTHDLSFADRLVLDTSKRVFYYPKDLLFTPYGEQWRKLRSIIVHQLLNSKRVKSFNPIIVEETSLLVEKIILMQSCKSPVNLTEMFESVAIDTIYRSTFGKKHSEIETKHSKRAVDTINEGVSLVVNFNIGAFIPWLAWTNKLNGFDVAVNRVVKTRDEILDAVIQEHLDATKDESCREYLIDTLLDIYKLDETSIDIESVKALILDVVAAGTETSSTALGWAMTELVRHPTVMKKLQDEVKHIMNGKHDILINGNDLTKMHYLKAVIKETLRYHPPIAVNLHECREDVNLMGYAIAAKTGVLINTWSIGRDPDYWDEPDKFLPERFMTNSSIDFKGFDFQFIPFGAGRRICPGISFAIDVIELVLANVVHKFDWALPNGEKGDNLDVIQKPGLTIGRKNPLILLATKRPRP
ncbi:hypothetical protein RD792_002998 [Penstemon davidsonii]|uniref:Cytochrome P450 n=1 Tax=Penstemon davidsonii TaxID=160366 RepID=A0ABR0DSG6_9LAMI|nr:hypothetical protein RD792_002998 [Penstemon davidsonii]